MTKSLPSAIKLRLSRLVRCLLALGCLKLIIMGVAIFDLPIPAWKNAPQEKTIIAEAPEVTGKVLTQEVQDKPVIAEQPSLAKTDDALPQGPSAAELAAMARPRTNSIGASILPAPIMNGAGSSAPGAFTPKLPTPPALGLPLAKAGIILPNADKEKKEENIWDALALTSLPIPGLGSVQAAHAAALDMPVPATPPTKSPFTPSEQIQAGRPPMTGNLNQNLDANFGGPDVPAPNIQPQVSALDPNVKNQELARQQQDLLMLRQQMDQRLKDLENAEGKMKDMLREANTVEEQKVKGLIQMYSNMKPRMAAQAMEKMDERIAVRILSGMPPKQSGEILTYTNPAKTAKFTEMITRLKMSQ